MIVKYTKIQYVEVPNDSTDIENDTWNITWNLHQRKNKEAIKKTKESFVVMKWGKKLLTPTKE